MTYEKPIFGTLEYCQMCPWWVDEGENDGHCGCPQGYECPTGESV